MARRSRTRGWTRRAGLGVAATAAGLAGVQAYLALRFRRTAADGVELPESPGPGSVEFARLVEVLTGVPARSGNRVDVLRNGDQFFGPMLEAIGGARHSVDFSCYIYWPGAITEQFTEAFMERARARVEVNVILDGWGSAKLSRGHVRRLEEGGVSVAVFRPPKWHRLGVLNNRMHRRLLIVDGRVAFAGGVGIADVWTGDATDSEHWRETQLRIEGPAVRDVLGGFVEDWVEATGATVAPSHFPELEDRGEVAVQVTRSSPAPEGTAAAKVFYAAIACARRRAWLTTAYLTAGRAFIDVLVEAAGRGVDVRLLVNGPHIDKAIVRRTAQRSYHRLLEAGVRIYEYRPSMLHAKVLVVDDGWANVGTSNYDHRSFALDDELNVSIQDVGVAAVLEGQFLADLDDSDEVSLERWDRRPVWGRLAELAGEAVRHSF